jgi:hypothetical protein
METANADARAVLAELQRRNAQDAGPWPAAAKRAIRPRRPMADHEALGYLHSHWALPDRPRAIGGKGWRAVARRLADRVVFGTIGDHLAAERDLFARVVQLCDALARRVDELQEDVAALSAEVVRHSTDLAAHRQNGTSPQ